MTCGQRASAASSVAVPEATMPTSAGAQRIFGVTVEQRDRQALVTGAVHRVLERIARARA